MSRIAPAAGFLLMVGGLVGLVLRREAFSPAPLVIALQAAAVGLMLWARVVFGRRSFRVSTSPADGGLVRSGPYRWIRHPIYTAVCLFAAACVVGHPSWFALSMAGLVGAGSLARLLAEEKHLRVQYPEYADYARQVKRMVPFVF
jgi:protein-S-isoprenylcysteine O-methyltransferase Ste14